MKKLLFLMLLATPLWSAQKYSHKDPVLNEEFVNNYKEHKYPNWVNATGSTMTISQLNVSSITATGSTTGIRGRVLQVVSTYTATAVLSTADVYANTDLSTTITPLQSGSTIYIFISQNVEPYQNATTANPNCAMQIMRNTTSIMEYVRAFVSDETGNRTTMDSYWQNGIIWYDCPNTTSAVRYGTQFKNDDASGQCYVQDGGGKSTMVLMEVF